MKVGAYIQANVMGKMSEHVPDRSVICKYGNFYVEFKGPATKLREGQRLWMERCNARYPCAFIYRGPNILTMLGWEGTVYIDAIAEPATFLRYLKEIQDEVLHSRG